MVANGICFAPLSASMGLCQKPQCESFNSSNSRGIDEVLNNKLRHDAVILRKMINEDHANEEAIDETRRKMLNENYRMLAYAFGEPVSHFDFEYRTRRTTNSTAI